MDPVSKAAGGCRVIAFDRPPFGLTERPLSWTGGDANSPYSAQVCSSPDSLALCSSFQQRLIYPVSLALRSNFLANMYPPTSLALRSISYQR